MKKISLAIVLVILLSACSASNTESPSASFDGMDYSTAPMSTPAPAAAPEVAFEREMTASDSVAEESGFGYTAGNTTAISGQQPDVSLTDPNRKLIYTSNMNIETQSFDESIANIESLCATYQGFIENSSISGMSITMRGKQFRNANYTFRIPSKHYKEFLNAIGTIGNITNKSQYTEDVSDSYYDVETRLNMLEMQRDRLFDRLEKETNSKTIIEYEKSLTETLYEIESLTGTLRRYDSLVDYSTVYVYLGEVEEFTEIAEYKQAPKTVGERIKTAFGDSTQAIGNFLVDVFVLLVGNILYILIWVVIIVICVIIYGTSRKRLRQRKLKAPETTKETDEKGD